MPSLLYRLTHRRFTQRATLRSLHVLGTALEMGCPLDQSLALTVELSETWGLREHWEHIAARMADGDSLSQLMVRLQPPFTPPMAAMAELGEVYGHLPGALKAAAGLERVDVFSPELQRRSRALADAMGELRIHGPIRRIAKSLVWQAYSQGSDGLGFFIGLPNPMDGPRLWVQEAPVAMGDGSAVGTLAAGIREAERFVPPAYSGEPDQPGELLQEMIFDPGSVATGQAVVGFRKDGKWRQKVVLPNYVFASLMRHLLFVTRIPYWSTESRNGRLRVEAGDRWHHLSARFAPTARQLALTLYFEPAVTAA